MYRGTTPTICLTVMTSLDLSKIKTVWVTFQNLVYERTYTGEEVKIVPETKKIYVEMSQEETLSLSSGKLDIQIRFLMDDGRAYATEIATTTVEDVLRDGVIDYVPAEGGGESGDIPGDGGDGSSDSDIVDGGFRFARYR